MSRSFKNSKFQKGHRQGLLKIVNIDNSREYKSGDRTYYLCRCDCGKVISLPITTFTKSNKKDCGCQPSKDLVGKKFGKVKITRFAGYDKRYKSRKARWIGVCSQCGEEKIYLQEVLLRGNISSCGKCKPTGKNHPRYNPNSDRFNRRDSKEYKEWCKSVFKRDKYRCDCCGKRGWINAHHLDGWNWCFAGRFDVNNGVTLCAGKNSCHNDFHNKYGRGGNTKAQYLEYKRLHNAKRKNT